MAEMAWLSYLLFNYLLPKFPISNPPMSESPSRPRLGRPARLRQHARYRHKLKEGRPDRLKGIIGSPSPSPLIVLVESPQKAKVLPRLALSNGRRGLGGPSVDIPVLGIPPWHGLLVGYTATSGLGFADTQTTSGKVSDKRSWQRCEWPLSATKGIWPSEWQVYRGELAMHSCRVCYGFQC